MKQRSILSFLEKPQRAPASLVVATVQTQSHSNYDQTEDETAESVAIEQDTSSLFEGQQNGSEYLAIEIVQMEHNHLSTLRALTSTLLPVRYSDKFYRDCLIDDARQAIARVVIYESKIVGWIRCRLETASNKHESGPFQIYIQALGVLAPYRGLGLAMKLLDAIEKLVRDLPFPVLSIYAHVWEDNERALTWYEKRGFRRIVMQQQYYKRLRPSGAWTVRREIVPV